MSTNKPVYLVELNCVIGVYEDLDMAIESALKNSDDSQTIDDLREAVNFVGMCKICRKPFPDYHDNNLCYYPTAIITKHALVEKGGNENESLQV